jgi:hypothetical protein
MMSRLHSCNLLSCIKSNLLSAIYQNQGCSIDDLKHIQKDQDVCVTLTKAAICVLDMDLQGTRDMW